MLLKHSVTVQMRLVESKHPCLSAKLEYERDTLGVATLVGEGPTVWSNYPSDRSGARPRMMFILQARKLVGVPAFVLVGDRAVGESWKKPVKEWSAKPDHVAVEPPVMPCRIRYWAKREKHLEKLYLHDESQKDQGTAHYPAHGRIWRSQYGEDGPRPGSVRDNQRNVGNHERRKG